jgi:hypothetical protein
MRDTRRALVLLFAAALLAALPVRAPAEEQASATTQGASAATPRQAARGRVDIDTGRGYARLLFTYPRPTPVAASIADGVLTLRLGGPVDASVEFFAERLAGYVTKGRREGNGLTYRFPIAKALALHSSSVLNRTAVDLIPDSFKGVPPELPPPPPPPPKPAVPDVATLAPLKVRVGEYANFTRLIFDWPKSVEYTVYPGRGRVSARFQALARPDFSMLDQRSPAWVKNAGWRIEGTATIVDFETDPESGFHDFREGSKIVIDVLAPKTDASAYAPPRVDEAPPILIAPPPAPRPAAVPNPPPAGSDAAAALNFAAAAAPPASAPSVAAPIAARLEPPQPGPAQMRAPSAEVTREGSVLHFPQAKGHAIAIFVRGETTWIVLDNHPALDVASLIAPLTSAIAKADTSQVSGTSILKLVFKAPLMASVSESEVALNIALTGGASSAPDAINLTRQGADGQTTLTTPLAGAMHAIALTDPDAGDQLLVVPARPGKGVLRARRFVELEALASTAGLVVVPFADDLSIRVENETVTFSRPQGLALSSSSGANVEPIVQMEQSKAGPGFVDFSQWGRGPAGEVFDSERVLRAAVARLPESESNKARLQLAHYLLAHDLAPEAIGVIGLIQSTDASLAADPSLQAMKGAAQVMMGRYSDARLSLSSDRLANDPHAALWRGMAAAKLGNYGDARRDLLLAKAVLPMYPQAWQTRARLARAETGLAQGDLASAADALDQLDTDLSPRDSVEARLYASELLAAQGHINEAVARLRGLETTAYTPVAAKATFARVTTLLGANKIKSDDAIEALENLRFRWRGDDLELQTLRRLGSLYFADSRWREGLATLRIAALNFPNAELARDAQDDMRRAFSDLFLGGKADAIPPVQALALFYDFIELTPIGRDGDEMIRRLTDRLVAVDLLGPAEQLLDHQVSQRLDGVARASVATKLAVIYLLDHKPDQALKTLNATRQTRLPDDINSQRRLLEARSLAGLKRYDAAVNLIADDESRDAKRLRADIYWDSANWKLAGAKLEEILGSRWNESAALADAERDIIMRAAVAYSLGGEEPALDKLREHYAAKMDESADAKAFAVVTERIENQGVAFRDLAKRIASVDSLQAMMDEFKKSGTALASAAAGN